MLSNLKRGVTRISRFWVLYSGCVSSRDRIPKSVLSAEKIPFSSVVPVNPFIFIDIFSRLLFSESVINIFIEPSFKIYLDKDIFKDVDTKGKTFYRFSSNFENTLTNVYEEPEIFYELIAILNSKPFGGVRLTSEIIQASKFMFFI